MHLFLNGEGAAPDIWQLSVLCREFGYSLRQALWELYGIRWEQAPFGLHWLVLEVREYAQAKVQDEQNAVSKTKIDPKQVTPMMRKVWEIKALIGADKRAEHERSQSSGSYKGSRRSVTDASQNTG